MIEVKFTAEKQDGQAISGSLSVVSYGEGKKKIQRLAEKNHLKIKAIERKIIYLYKARKGTDKPIRGEQKAYSKKEVEDALIKLGYKVLSINRKLINFQRKPPTAEIVTFVKISAELLEQRLAYGEILSLLINDTQNKALKDTLKEINNDLKKGADSEATFLKYQSVFGKFTAYMLGLASKSGNMTEIYRATAKFLERRQEFKKNLSEYPQYLGKELTDKIAQVLIINKKPTLSSTLWTDALAKFLKICYQEDFNSKLIPKIDHLLAPIFYWRAISFWGEMKNLPAKEIDKIIRNQAKLLRKKLIGRSK